MTTVTDNYGNDHTLPGPFASVWEIRIANDRIGHHFFTSDTKRFFASRISATLFGGRLFVTSEQSPNDVRRYTVRVAADNGVIAEVGGYGAHDTLAAAKQAAQVAAGV